MGTTRLYERWDEIDSLFEQAVTLPSEELEAFCRNACGDDHELFDLLWSLVVSAQTSDEAIRRSVSQLAEDIASDTPLTGERINAYRLEGLLGRGGMGDVYLARRDDGAFERTVAIKVVRNRRVNDAFAVLFRKERQVLADLKHPSIPALIDAGQLDDGRLYFISDYIDGVSAAEYCDDATRTFDDKLTLLTRIGEALQHAHNNLILHLDIKPDNVLVQSDGTPCLLDFGIARLVGEEVGGNRAYTPGYASPEQIRGEHVTAASDVFSLGALAYRMLTGTRPFDPLELAPAETIMLAREDAAKRVARFAELEALAPDIQAIVRKAMHDDPAERYATVESFLRDIKHFRLSLPVAARRGGFRYRLGKYVKRQRVAIGVVVAALSGLAAFAAHEASLRDAAQAASVRAEQEADAAGQISDFLIELFRVSDPSEARGSSVTARELLDNGAARIPDDLEAQPLLQSRLMRVIGDVYTQLGLLDDAARIMENALRVREAAGADDDELGTLLTNLGIVYLKQTRLDDAEVVLLRGLDLREDANGAFALSVGNSLNYVGVLRTLQGQYDTAIALLQRAVKLHEENLGPDDYALAEPLRNLSTAYYRQGQTAEAIRLNRRALAIVRESVASDHPALALTLDNLGNNYQAAGRYEEALEVMTEALSIREKVLSPTHPMLANTLENMGTIQYALRKFESAEPLMLRALAIREEVLGPTHRHMGTSLGNLGNLYMEWGKLDRAEELLTRSLELRRQIYEADNPRLAVAMLNLGSLYLKRSELDRATTETLGAMAIFSAKLEPDHLYLLHSEWQLANIRSEQGRIDEARTLFDTVKPRWEVRPQEDPDRADMLEDYAAFIAQHGPTTQD